MTAFDTPEPISVVLDVWGADVLIRAGDRPTTRVEVEPRDAVGVELMGGTLMVTSPDRRPAGRFGGLFGRTRAQVLIDVPTASHVRGSVTGETRGLGRFGECRLSTGDGDIRFDDTGPAELTTRNGEIRVRRIDGPATITNTNGQTRIGEVTGHLRLTDTNGDIIVDHAGGDVDGRTAYGEISLGEVVRGTVTLATAGGELAVGIATGTAAWLDIDTAGGEVHNELDAAPGPDAADETVEILARTGGGDIRIHRA